MQVQLDLRKIPLILEMILTTWVMFRCLTRTLESTEFQLQSPFRPSPPLITPVYLDIRCMNLIDADEQFIIVGVLTVYCHK